MSRSFRGAAASSATGGIFAAVCAVAALALTAAPAFAQSFGGNGGASVNGLGEGGAGGGYGVAGSDGTAEGIVHAVNIGRWRRGRGQRGRWK